MINEMNYNNLLNYNQSLNHKNQVQMQDTLKLEEQAYSNEILCRMLSAAECYYNRLMHIENEREIFGYYNAFNLGNIKEKEKLKKQLLNAIELFKNSYEDYSYNYEKYDFPDNLPKSDIEQLIKKWRNNLLNYSNGIYRSEANYYDGILKLINGNNDVTYRNEIKLMNKGKFNKEGSVAKQLSKHLPYVQEKAENLGKRIREGVLNGNITINVILYGDYRQDEDLIRGKEQFDKLDYNEDYQNNFRNNNLNPNYNNRNSNLINNHNNYNNNFNNNYNNNDYNVSNNNYNNNSNGDFGYYKNYPNNQRETRLIDYDDDNENEKTKLENEVFNIIDHLTTAFEKYLDIRKKIPNSQNFQTNKNKEDIIKELNYYMILLNQYYQKYLSKFDKNFQIQERLSTLKNLFYHNITENYSYDEFLYELYSNILKCINLK